MSSAPVAQPLSRGWADRALQRVYDRHQSRGLLTVYFIVAPVTGLCYCALTSLIGAKFMGVSTSDVLLGQAFITVPLIAVTVSIALWRHRAAFRTAWGWRGEYRGPANAPAAWVAIQDVIRTVLTFIYLLLAAIPISVVPFVSWLDKPWWFAIPLTFGLILNFAALMVMLYFFAEWGTRPARTDVARFLPDDFDPPEARTRLGWRIAAPFPALAATITILTFAYGNQFSNTNTRFAFGVALGFLAVVLAGLLFLAVSRLTLAPLADLKAATVRVQDGDFTTRVPILSTDELGDLARSFNQMLSGLQEREELRKEVKASRARIVAASDAERRRIERNIHDGAQQQLVGLALKLRMLEDTLDSPEAKSAVHAVQDRLKGALEELRELARGLHPSVLSTDGLEPALAHLAEHSAVPVDVDAPERRFPEMVESTAHYVASEALANVAKYAQASSARVHVNADNGRLVLTVTDDGIGGAHANPGSGLAGLKDRVEAIDGRLTITSPAGQGTRLVAELPLS